MKKLPKIDLTIYKTKLPSNGKEILYRGYTFKEEKILLTAKESDDLEQIILAMKQILTNCIVESKDIDLEELAYFDVEYMYLAIRSKSVSNIAKFTIQDPDTNEDIKLMLDIDKIKLAKDPQHTNKIKLDDTYTLFLKYPTIETVLSSVSSDDSFISCMDKLVSENEVLYFKEYTKDEIENFIEGLESVALEKINTFLETMPKLRQEIKYKNSQGTERTFVIEGTKSFFM